MDFPRAPKNAPRKDLVYFSVSLGLKLLKILINHLVGGLAIAVPGQIKGLWEAKQRYGNPQVSWESLIQPSIDLCLEGIPVSFTTAQSLKSKRYHILQDPGIVYVF